MRLPQDRILHIDTEIKGGKVIIVAEWQGELIRCKDCRFFKCEECRYYIAHGIRRKPNDFCSNGKPKGGENE